jgi:hypothetical protein
MAWAVEHHAGGTRPLHLLVVARPGTLLPTIVASWPRVELDGGREGLADLLAAELRETPPAVVLPPAVAAEAESSALPAEADLAALRLRARHVRRFDEIEEEEAATLAAGQHGRSRVRAALREVGKGLGWTGHLADLDGWPADPMIRALRWRLGVLRTAAGIRWPLSGRLEEPDDLADDLDLLLLQRFPGLDWTTDVGWAEDERRFAVRHHASALRLVGGLVDSGMTAGLMHLPEARQRAWVGAATVRRQECVEALVEMRLQRRVGWAADGLQWDAAYRRTARWLRRRRSDPWSGPVPLAVYALVAPAIDDIAAVAAHTAWTAARSGTRATQWFTTTDDAEEPVRIQVHAGGPAPATDRRAVRLGLEPDADGVVAVTLDWTGFPGPAGPVRAVPQEHDRLHMTPR